MENSSELSTEKRESLDTVLQWYRDNVIAYNVTRLRWELYNLLPDDVKEELQNQNTYWSGTGTNSDWNDTWETEETDNAAEDGMEADAGLETIEEQEKEGNEDEDEEMMDITEFELLKRRYAKIMRGHSKDFDDHYRLPEDVWSIKELLEPDNLHFAVPDGTNPLRNGQAKTQAEWLDLAEQRLKNQAVESERASLVLPAEYRYLMTLTDGFIGPDLPYQWHLNILECFSGPSRDKAPPLEELKSCLALNEPYVDWTVYAGLLTGTGSLCTAECGLLLCERPGKDMAWRIFYLPEDGEYTDLAIYDDFEHFLYWYAMDLPRGVVLPTLEEDEMDVVGFRRRFSRISMQSTP